MVVSVELYQSVKSTVNARSVRLSMPGLRMLARTLLTYMVVCYAELPRCEVF